MSELSQSQAKERPVLVTILAILAGIAAVIAAVHAIQFLGIFPFVVGPSGYTVHYFSFWVCADVWVALLGLHLADDGALARRTWSLDIPGDRHHVLSDHRLVSVDWRIHLAGCLLFFPLQWHHPAVLHAPWREESFRHAVIRVLRGGVIRVLKGVPAGYALKHQSK